MQRSPHANATRFVRRNSEAGETLVEVLVTITIIGIAFAALLGSLLTSTSASVTDRSVVNLDGILRGFAETARYEIQTQPEAGGSVGPSYEPCATSYPLISDPYPSSGPITGSGTNVIVFATGFASRTALTVQVGGTPVTPISGGTTDANGNSTILFAATSAGNVSVKGNNSSGISVTDTAKVAFTQSSVNPGITASTYQNYVLTSSVTPYNSSGCPSSIPSQQQIALSLTDPQSVNGSVDSLNFVVGDFAPDPVVISSNAINTTTGEATSTVPAQLTFTASVTTTTGSPEGAAGSKVTWALSGPSGGPTSCGTPTYSTATGTSTCVLTLAVGQQGTYQVAATYTNTSGTYPSGSEAQSTATLGAVSPGIAVTVSNGLPAGLVFKATVTGASGSSAPDVGCTTSPCFAWTVLASSSSSSSVESCTSTATPADLPGPPPLSFSTCTVSPPVMGDTYTASVTYGGSTNYGTAFDQSTIVVPTVAVTGTQTGSAYSYNITVSGPTGDAVPAGTIACAPSPTGPTVTTSALMVNGLGTASTATCSFTGTPPNAYITTITYTPDSMSSATYSAEPVVVPSVVISGSSTAADLVTFNITVTGPSSLPVPTGSVTCVPAPPPSGTVTTSSLTTNVAGTAATATCSFTGSTATPYTATVAYTPDATSNETYMPWTNTSGPVLAP